MIDWIPLSPKSLPPTGCIVLVRLRKRPMARVARYDAREDGFLNPEDAIQFLRAANVTHWAWINLPE